jgi:magnesium-transporting ATPase (P-type)
MYVTKCVIDKSFNRHSGRFNYSMNYIMLEMSNGRHTSSIMTFILWCDCDMNWYALKTTNILVICVKHHFQTYNVFRLYRHFFAFTLFCWVVGVPIKTLDHSQVNSTLCHIHNIENISVWAALSIVTSVVMCIVYIVISKANFHMNTDTMRAWATQSKRFQQCPMRNSIVMSRGSHVEYWIGAVSWL